MVGEFGGGALAADLIHGPLWAVEASVVDAVARPLGGNHLPNQFGDRLVAATAADQVANARLAGTEQELRTAPSAVNRRRSQLRQKGSLTGLMKPTRPAPSTSR
ncbi:hypothetical protein Pan181_32980 [Aeoliella mucimassa]|uniref:Uncharacterized protein n=1 Tax=Aeoliella mucimassa TaxID=2527972 RepID=A0A518AQU2_9BACT|nr:hypothetical protein Pan181_32980 [Aeoliella mucimassa]